MTSFSTQLALACKSHTLHTGACHAKSDTALARVNADQLALVSRSKSVWNPGVRTHIHPASTTNQSIFGEDREFWSIIDWYAGCRERVMICVMIGRYAFGFCKYDKTFNKT